MIHRLELENFFSFRDRVAFDLTLKPKAGDPELFAPAVGDAAVNKIAAIYGANASGKTQLLKALAFLRWWLVDSCTLAPDEEIPVMPFLFDESSKTRPSSILLEFSVQKSLYRYQVTLAEDRVVAESLYVRKTRWNILFERNWDAHTSSQIFSKTSGAVWKNLPASRKASLISWAWRQQRSPVVQEIGDWLNGWTTNVTDGGRIASHGAALPSLLSAAKHFDSHPSQLEWVNQRLSHYDLGLTGVRIDKAQMIEDGQEKTVYLPIGLHKNGELPMPLESQGTQALFVMLRHLLPVLESGGVAILDEFEHGLHPHMLPILTELFLGRHNPKNAQLIVSCHGDYLLHSLDRRQLYLTQKDEDGISDLWRGDETSARTQVSLASQYHAGKLGGVPSF